MTNSDPQLPTEDTLLGDDVDDELDRGYSPPEKPSAAQRYGTTAWEQSHDRPLADRLAEEVPDTTVDPLDAEDDGLAHDADEAGTEVGDERAGRLVEPDAGLGEDVDADLVAEDVGIDGAAASAEEAAVHVIPDDEEL